VNQQWIYHLLVASFDAAAAAPVVAVVVAPGQSMVNGAVQGGRFDLASFFGGEKRERSIRLLQKAKTGNLCFRSHLWHIVVRLDVCQGSEMWRLLTKLHLHFPEP
jgi:hypothetical protein